MPAAAWSRRPGGTPTSPRSSGSSTWSCASTRWTSSTGTESGSARSSEQVHELARRLDIPDLLVMPISALHGDNVALTSDHAPFYDGPDAARVPRRSVDVQADRDLRRLRLPVQWVGRPQDGGDRLYAGQDRRRHARRRRPGGRAAGRRDHDDHRVDTLDADAGGGPADVGDRCARRSARRRPWRHAGGPERSARRPLASSDCTICWMSEEPLHPGRRYALKHTTRTVRATVQEIVERTDPRDARARARSRPSLAVNDIGRVTLRTSSPVMADPYSLNRVTGAFILIDEDSNDTVAAGVIRTARSIEAGREDRRDVTWHPVRARPRRALAGDRPARRDGPAHRAVGVRQVDDRGGARAPPGR